MVKVWTNYNNFCCLTCQGPISPTTLVIHNYCQSQISFPANRSRSTHLTVNDTGHAPPRGMIRTPIDYTKWTMVLVEPKVHYACCHKYQWNVDGGGFYFLLDEHVSWSPQTKQSRITCFWKSPGSIRKIFVTHTTLKLCFKSHSQGEEDVVLQGDNMIMRVDAAIRWIFSF